MNGINSKSFVIIGASGVGKGTIINNLKEKYPNLFELVLSFTTRKIRPNEKHGVNYYYVSHQQFNEKIPQMLEYKLVHKNWYGTSRAHLDYIKNLDKIPILDVDIEGMLEIKEKINCEVLCLMPASWSLLESRLVGRKTQPAQVVQSRMKQNRRQVQKMLTLANKNGIWFATNYQFQLTTYGIQKWLSAHFQRFENERQNILKQQNWQQNKIKIQQ